MPRHLIKETMGDDSLNDYTHFMKKNNDYKKKTKLYIYSWVYNGNEFILQTPPTSDK